MTKETPIKQRILEALRKAGCWAVKYHSSGVTGKGVPDILCCAPGGRFIAFEVKAPGGRLDPAQRANLTAVVLAGGEAYVVTSARAAVGFVEQPKHCRYDGFELLPAA